MTAIDHPDFSQPVNFDTMQLPDSGEGQVSGTIAMMRRYAVQDSKHPALVQQLNARLQGCMDVHDALQRIFDQAKQSMYFQRDEATGDWLAPDVVEVLVRPADVALLTQQPDSQPVPGDCDCFSMYIAAMLQHIGVPCAFVTVSANPTAPNQFSHVYVVAFPNEPDARTVMDASHGPYIGWEAPNTGRYKEWPLCQGDSGTAGAFPILMFLSLVATAWWAYERFFAQGAVSAVEEYA